MVWHTWYEDALVVLALEPEQPLEGAAGAAQVEVTMRSKDTGARLVTWTGAVQVVRPDQPSWPGHAEALLGVRLNLRDPEAALATWRERGTVLRITPS
jgi:hypothetical protein